MFEDIPEKEPERIPQEQKNIPSRIIAKIIPLSLQTGDVLNVEQNSAKTVLYIKAAISRLLQE